MQYKILFIHSIFSSGLSSLNRSFERIPEIDYVQQERFNGISDINYKYLKNKISKRKAKDLLKDIFTYRENVSTVVEICVRSSALINIQYELFPNSKFLWWIRDGRNVVRTQYSQHFCKWLFDLESESTFLKYCEQWNKINTTIETQFLSLPSYVKKGPVKLEENKSLLPILKWWGIHTEAEGQLLHYHKTHAHEIPKWTYWDKKMKDKAKQYLNPYLKKAGYIYNENW